MKKVMIVAAAATLAAASYGSIAVTNCTPPSLGCPQVVFKVSGSGKTAVEVEKGDLTYKTVSKIKITKGALVLWGSGDDGDACCYDNYSLYLKLKAGNVAQTILVPQTELDSWTIFGKNLAKADEYDGNSKKKFSLESQLGISGIDGSDAVDADLEDFDENFAFFATAFGKVAYKYSPESVKKSACSTGCDPASYDVIPASYSGWFAGVMSAAGEEYCLTCGCNELDVFGGTWKAKYDKSWSVKAGWKKAATYVFGSGTAKAMEDEGIE